MVGNVLIADGQRGNVIDAKVPEFIVRKAPSDKRPEPFQEEGEFGHLAIFACVDHGDDLALAHCTARLPVRQSIEDERRTFSLETVVG